MSKSKRSYKRWNYPAILSNLMQEERQVRHENKKVRMTMLEILLTKLRNDAMHGDTRATNLLDRFFGPYFQQANKDGQKSGIFLLPKMLTKEEFLKKYCKTPDQRIDGQDSS